MARSGKAYVEQPGWLVNPRSSYQDAIAEKLARRQTLFATALSYLNSPAVPLAEVATLLIETLRSGHKALAAGNGGSAAEAQHFAAELVGRFKRDRAPYAALALTTDSSVVTAVGNDYGFDQVFVRQILALGQPGDLLFAYSTSGESENLVRAVTAAHQREMAVVAMTGERPSRLERQSDLVLSAPASDTDTVQEIHMIITHLLCDLVEGALSNDDQDR